MTREEIINLSNNYKTSEERGVLKRFFSSLDNIDPNKRTIVYAVPGESGTSYFSCFEPLLAMYRASSEFNYVYAEPIMPTHFNLADLILLHRASPNHDFVHDLFNTWPSHKIRPYLIHTVDDNEMNLSRVHSMYTLWQIEGRSKQSERSVSECDAVEITTRKLKQVMLNHNKNVYIRRNYFNWKLPQWNLEKKKQLTDFVEITDEQKREHFNFPEEWKDKIVLGWAGLTSHYKDIEKMQPIFKAIHDKYPNVVFVLAGMALKDSMYDIGVDEKTGKQIVKGEVAAKEEDKYRTRVQALFSDFDQSRVKIYDAIDLHEYGWFYSLFDIGIAYIEHNGFNQCKSEIKVVEYAKYGAMPVYSNFGGYSDLNDILLQENVLTPQEINKLACRTEFNTKDWIDKLSYWIENYKSDEFNDVIGRLQKFVTEYYDIDRLIIDKIAMYKSFIEENVENQQIMQKKLYVPERLAA